MRMQTMQSKNQTPKVIRLTACQGRSLMADSSLK
jgi:hypothetical protein